MADRLERRTQFAEIDVRSTERFGSLCSPFQALHLPVHSLYVLTLPHTYMPPSPFPHQEMENVNVPKELSAALHSS